MRIKSSQQYFDFSEPSSLKIVKEYRQKYQKISELLDQNPQILTLAHKDWAKLLSSSPKGRSGYSSEQLLRTLMVMFIEQQDYRGTVILVDTSDVLRPFARLAPGATMDFTFLNKAYNALGSKTLEQINAVLNDFATSQNMINGEKQRMDTPPTKPISTTPQTLRCYGTASGHYHACFVSFLQICHNWICITVSTTRRSRSWPPILP